MSMYKKRGIVHKRTYYYSKKALPILATLEALFEFKVIRKRSFNVYKLSGNSTRSNAKRDEKIMFRNAFEDARIRLFNILGGSYKYDSQLKNYVFIYRDTEEYEDNYNKGKTRNIEYYNEQIPETMRRYDVQPRTKKTKTTKRRNKSKSKKNTRNNKAKPRQKNNSRTTTQKRRIQNKRNKNTKKALEYVR